MKKNYLWTLLLFCFLLSCSQDKEFIPEETTSSLRTLADGNNDALGFSYDITDNYLDIDATKYRVIDMDKFAKDNPLLIYRPSSTKINQDIYAGSDSENMLQDIIEKSGFSGSVGSKVLEESGSTTKSIIKKLLPFTGTIKGGVNKEKQETYKYASCFSYAQAFIKKRVKRLYIDADANLLSNYLTEQFTKDINTKSADELVAKYGTHVLADITIGGSYNVIYRSSIVEETNTEIKKKTVTAGLNASLGKIGLDTNGSSTTEETKTYSTKNTNWQISIVCEAGEGTGTSMSFDSSTGITNTSINFHSWQASVTDRNSKLVEVNWNKIFFIYDFIKDPTKKAAVKAAVVRYVAGRQLQLMSIIPMYTIYHTQDKIHITTTGTLSDHLRSPYSTFVGIAGYCFPYQESTTIPLYEYLFKNTPEHIVTTDNYMNSNVSQKFIIGYVYPYQYPGTIPLNEYMGMPPGKNYGDHVTSAYSDVVQNYSRGNYKTNWNVGYVFPRLSK
ncbi:hypothetical protein G7051_11895 [Dysgonomonas sp. HDW5B]|uniref:MAC/perforin domain-containing protein n=1 Tax=Dysgonomonas sp. HDW5B TaxID=2714927 RepID=UPI00140B0B8F|nr:MAC/perforin domain-containing protein [Dysgonomonas sp. HDW5B]QIK55001.1 hypothetical protein G7051_11895 [Dysgonomonas sp. HDW5B]